MFWPLKKKMPPTVAASSVHALATQLGVERRQTVRMRYPRRPELCKLPLISFQDHPMQVQDISVGGCCLLDPSHHLGPAVGQVIKLKFQWTTGVDLVQAKIVSRVDDRRHIQFLDLSAHRQNHLRKLMSAGVLGTNLKRHIDPLNDGPELAVSELWSSPDGQTVQFESDPHLQAKILFEARPYTIYRGSWPVREDGLSCEKVELERLTLFLANVPNPSERLNGLYLDFENHLFGGSAR